MVMRGIKVFLELVIGYGALIIGSIVFEEVIRRATYRACGEGSPDHSTAVRWWGQPAAWALTIVVILAVAWVGMFILNL